MFSPFSFCSLTQHRSQMMPKNIISGDIMSLLYILLGFYTPQSRSKRLKMAYISLCDLSSSYFPGLTFFCFLLLSCSFIQILCCPLHLLNMPMMLLSSQVLCPCFEASSLRHHMACFLISFKYCLLR